MNTKIRRALLVVNILLISELAMAGAGDILCPNSYTCTGQSDGGATCEPSSFTTFVSLSFIPKLTPGQTVIYNHFWEATSNCSQNSKNCTSVANCDYHDRTGLAFLSATTKNGLVAKTGNNPWRQEGGQYVWTCYLSPSASPSHCPFTSSNAITR